MYTVMAKRKAEVTGNIGTLQLASLQQTLETEQGLSCALNYLLDSQNSMLRQRIKDEGFVVAKKDRVEKLMHEMQSLDRRAESSQNESQRTLYVKTITETLHDYKKVGIDMTLAEKKTRFEGACVSNGRYGYSSQGERYNLTDGMVHVGDSDTHMPYDKAEESWHTYYAGEKGCAWAKTVLDALQIPTDMYMILVPQRIVSVKWRSNKREGDMVENDDVDVE
jgi:hypothetical protein